MKLDNPEYLHPLFELRVRLLMQRLAEAEIPLRLYETARSPWRQAVLYARGRTSAGKKVTNAKAWQSFHQFGLAADFVFYVDGKWTWLEPKAGQWKRYHELAKGVGLDVLSSEMPHVQFPWSMRDLERGHYPVGGETSTWLRFFTEWCETWGSWPRTESGVLHPAAPPPPGIDDRPEIGDVA